MRKNRNKHDKLNEDIQNLLSYVGELIDDVDWLYNHDEIGIGLHELYQWLNRIMVNHYENNITN
jgi:hypothetical protein